LYIIIFIKIYKYILKIHLWLSIQHFPIKLDDKSIIKEFFFYNIIFININKFNPKT